MNSASESPSPAASFLKDVLTLQLQARDLPEPLYNIRLPKLLRDVGLKTPQSIEETEEFFKLFEIYATEFNIPQDLWAYCISHFIPPQVSPINTRNGLERKCYSANGIPRYNTNLDPFIAVSRLKRGQRQSFQSYANQIISSLETWQGIKVQEAQPGDGYRKLLEDVAKSKLIKEVKSRDLRFYLKRRKHSSIHSLAKEIDNYLHQGKSYIGRARNVSNQLKRGKTALASSRPTDMARSGLRRSVTPHHTGPNINIKRDLANTRKCVFPTASTVSNSQQTASAKTSMCRPPQTTQTGNTEIVSGAGKCTAVQNSTKITSKSQFYQRNEISSKNEGTEIHRDQMLPNRSPAIVINKDEIAPAKKPLKAHTPPTNSTLCMRKGDLLARGANAKLQEKQGAENKGAAKSILRTKISEVKHRVKFRHSQKPQKMLAHFATKEQQYRKMKPKGITKLYRTKQEKVESISDKKYINRPGKYPTGKPSPIHQNQKGCQSQGNLSSKKQALNSLPPNPMYGSNRVHKKCCDPAQDEHTKLVCILLFLLLYQSSQRTDQYKTSNRMMQEN